MVARARTPSWITADLLLPLALATVTLAVFAPVIGHGWVDLDDDHNFLRNPHYRGLGASQLRWMLTAVVSGHWVPVTWLTHGLDHVLWGMNPAGYHLGNVLLHAANAALVYVLARRLLALAMPGTTSGWLGASTAALLFALHPLRVESVAWISERRDVLAGLFYLLTLLAWLRARAAEAPWRRRWYLLSLVSFVLGLLSKSMLVSVPLVLLVLEVYPLRRLDPRAWRSATTRRVLLETAPYFALALVALVVTSLTMRAAVPLTSLTDLPLWSRVAMAAHSLVFYPWKLLAPLDLRPMYPRPAHLSALEPRFLVAVLAVLAITVILVAARRRWPAGLSAWLAYAIALAPVSGLVHAGPQLVADRFAYMPSLAFCLLLGGAVSAAAQRPLPVRLVPALVALWIASLAVLTSSQLRIWRDTDTLFAYMLLLEPDCAWCHAQYGAVLGNGGDLERAIPHFRRAAALRPSSGQFQANAGLALLRTGRPVDALPYLERAVTAQPDNLAARAYLGQALTEVGRPADAAPHLERVRAVGRR
jgi:protein O-mannosyl-transferase